MKDLVFIFNDDVTIKPSKLADLLGMNFAVGDTIYLTISEYQRYLNNNKKPDETLYHEYVHILQQRETGLLNFLVKYLLACPILWNPFRKQWELEAYRVSLAWQIKCYGFVSGSYKQFLATTLSSSGYGWMMSKKEAEEWIERTLEEFKSNP